MTATAFWILYTYLLLATLHLLLFSIAGFFYRQERRTDSPDRRRRFAVLIPAYREDSVILATARHSVRQLYPEDLYDVIVIADSLQPETVGELRSIPVSVLEVSFDNSSKARSLNEAAGAVTRDYDAVVIIDADNLMEERFLEKANACLDTGFRVLQAHRTAKNTSTPVALLDAASEEINNHLFRKGRRALGLPSALIGSGIVMDRALYSELIPNLKTVGEDKELERMLLKKRMTTGYLDDTLVLDEKVSRSEVFQKQRTRWLGTQWQMLSETLPELPAELLLRGNIAYADKVLQMLFPPRLLLLGGSIMLTALALTGIAGPVQLFWVGILLLQVATFAIALPRSFRTVKFLRAALQVPGLFLRMVRALLSSPGSGKTFIHTPHDDHSTTRKDNV
ncbi:MAG: glycosyltransferase [Prosthecochloris sp.]|nr:glycosyltransferase [Prosthecochloris sp.]